MGRYDDLFKASTDDPESFWRKAADAIDWYTPPTRALDAGTPPLYPWVPDGQPHVASTPPPLAGKSRTLSLRTSVAFPRYCAS